MTESDLAAQLAAIRRHLESVDKGFAEMMKLCDEIRQSVDAGGLSEYPWITAVRWVSDLYREKQRDG